MRSPRRDPPVVRLPRKLGPHCVLSLDRCKDFVLRCCVHGELKSPNAAPASGCSAGRSAAVHPLARDASLRKFQRGLLAAAQASCTSISTIFTPIAAGPMTSATKFRKPRAPWSCSTGGSANWTPATTAGHRIPSSSRCAKQFVAKDIPQQPFADLLKAFRQDQVVKRYPTWESVIDYCVYSANPVGRLVLYFAAIATKSGNDSPTLPAPRCSWQISGRTFRATSKRAASISRSTSRRPSRQRKRYCRAPLRRTIRRIMKDLIAKTRALFAQGAPLAKMVDGKLSVDLEMFSRGGIAVLDAIETMGYDTLHRRPPSAKPNKSACWAARWSLACHRQKTKSARYNKRRRLCPQIPSPHPTKSATASSKPRTAIFITAFFLLPKPKTRRPRRALRFHAPRRRRCRRRRQCPRQAARPGEMARRL